MSDTSELSSDVPADTGSTTSDIGSSGSDAVSDSGGDLASDTGIDLNADASTDSSSDLPGDVGDISSGAEATDADTVDSNDLDSDSGVDLNGDDSPENIETPVPESDAEVAPEDRIESPPDSVADTPPESEIETAPEANAETSPESNVEAPPEVNAEATQDSNGEQPTYAEMFRGDMRDVTRAAGTKANEIAGEISQGQRLPPQNRTDTAMIAGEIVGAAAKPLGAAAVHGSAATMETAIRQHGASPPVALEGAQNEQRIRTEGTRLDEPLIEQDYEDENGVKITDEKLRE